LGTCSYARPTEAGIFGQWYYSDTPGKIKGAARSSFKRAVTYSSGSVAFGSLIVALLDLLRFIIGLLRQEALSEGDAIGVRSTERRRDVESTRAAQAAIACVAQCCVGCGTVLPVSESLN
jgi:hypothetical protein